MHYVNTIIPTQAESFQLVNSALSEYFECNDLEKLYTTFSSAFTFCTRANHDGSIYYDVNVTGILGVPAAQTFSGENFVVELDLSAEVIVEDTDSYLTNPVLLCKIQAGGRDVAHYEANDALFMLKFLAANLLFPNMEGFLLSTDILMHHVKQNSK